MSAALCEIIPIIITSYIAGGRGRVRVMRRGKIRKHGKGVERKEKVVGFDSALYFLQ